MAIPRTSRDEEAVPVPVDRPPPPRTENDPLVDPSPRGSSPLAPSSLAPSSLAIDQLFHAYYDFVWRSLRRLGLPPEDADDASQEVFLVAQRRLPEILAGRERSFLFGTAMRVASGRRRSVARRPDRPGEVELVDVADPGDDAAAALDRRRGRERLDAILDGLPLELRAVFVLFELEGLTMAEIAHDLELAPGTVASRLRRARELFEAACARLQARDRRDEEGR